MADISQIKSPSRIVIWTPTENNTGFVSLEHLDNGHKRFMVVGEAPTWNMYPGLDVYMLNAIASAMQQLLKENGMYVPIFHSLEEGAK